MKKQNVVFKSGVFAEWPHEKVPSKLLCRTKKNTKVLEERLKKLLDQKVKVSSNRRRKLLFVFMGFTLNPGKSPLPAGGL